MQLYAERPEGTVERPPRVLAGFALADAAPGAEATAEIALDARALAHWQDGRWAVEPGPLTLVAGRSSRDLRLRAASVLRSTRVAWRSRRGPPRRPAVAV